MKNRFSRQIFRKKSSNVKFHEYLSSERRELPLGHETWRDGQADRRKDCGGGGGAADMIKLNFMFNIPCIMDQFIKK
jgi:hypothetical protein